MKNYKRINLILGILIGIAACAVYIMTAERTTSWWDCGQFLALAFKFQVGHPPGAPTFNLIGNLFTLLVGRDPMLAGFMVNVMSATASGLSIMFLFWTITILGKKLVFKLGEMTDAKMWMIFGSGIVGAMAYCFSDSFWFSAVEGEVYALSSFFTAVTFWAILRWDEVADQPHHLRWIILIFFLIGLAIGVHLLNLLVIPAIVFVIYYRKFEHTRKRFWYALGISGVLLGAILWGIIPQIVDLAGRFELFFVNGLGLPFNSGSYFYFTVLIGGIAWGLYYSIKKRKVLLNTILLCLVFLLVGYSTYFLIVIRANAGTPINQNEPKNAYALLDYLNREQYGQRPLVYGSFFTGRIIDVNRSPKFVRDNEAGRYVEAGSRVRYVYDPVHKGLFPRMHSTDTDRGHVQFYIYFSGYDGRQIERPDGRMEWSRKPTLAENIRFFIRYHLGWQYTRYFMWNFVGRQNDIPGRGFDDAGNRDVLNGNWISGIKFIDEARLGPQDNLPDFMKQNQGRNTYYFLPLILGLIGLIYQYRKDKQGWFVTFLLFFMTGIAIVIYLNQPSTEPRERDYSVVGSFYAFAIWIGLGVMAIAEFLHRKTKINGILAAGLTTVATFAAVPALMCQQNWDDHNRAHKSAARAFARNMLLSCEPNAILLVNGDNDTFPVWFMQEVEGLRTDVRVINSALANSHWHIQPLFSKVYDADPVKFTLRRDQYGQGALGPNDAIAIQDRGIGRRELIELVRFVASDSPNTRLTQRDGTFFNFLPSTQYSITINRDDLLERGIITQEQYHFTPSEIHHDIGSDHWIHRADFAFLDILATNNWERPIHVASPWAQRNVWPTQQFAQQEGITHRLVPYHNPNRNQTQSGFNGIATDKTYDLFMNQFTWGNLNADKARVGPESRRTAEQWRTQFNSLAQALVAEGKNDSAIRVLDRGLELFPHHKIAFDHWVIFYVQTYFRAGETEKALALANQLVDIHEANLRYFERFPSKYRKFMEEYINRSLFVFSHLRHNMLQGCEGNCEDLFARLTQLLESRGVQG